MDKTIIYENKVDHLQSDTYVLPTNLPDNAYIRILVQCDAQEKHEVAATLDSAEKALAGIASWDVQPVTRGTRIYTLYTIPTALRVKSLNGVVYWRVVITDKDYELYMYLNVDKPETLRVTDYNSAVVNTNDPVGYWLDLSGYGASATQFVLYNRPVYRGSYLEFDLVDDDMSITHAQGGYLLAVHERGHMVSRQIPEDLLYVPRYARLRGFLSTDSITPVFQTHFEQTFNTTEWWFVGECNRNDPFINIQTLANHQITFIDKNNNQVTSTDNNITFDLAALGLDLPVTVLVPKPQATDTITAIQINGLFGGGLLPEMPDDCTVYKVHSNNLSGSVPVVSSGITEVTCNDNLLTGWSSAEIPPTLTTINLQNNLLTQNAVDLILKAADSAGSSNGTLNVGGEGNSAPSTTGWGYYDSLVSKNWAVTVNGTHP